MKKLLLSAGLVLALLQAPAVHAAEKAVAQVTISDAEKAERLKYATDFADVRPIRAAIDRDIEAASVGMSEDERENFMRFVQLRIDYDKIEQDSIKIMAGLFSVPELKAMIAYYGSAEGKTAEAKAQNYTAQIAPLVRGAIDGALMDAKLGASR